MKNNLTLKSLKNFKRAMAFFLLDLNRECPIETPTALVMYLVSVVRWVVCFARFNAR